MFLDKIFRKTRRSLKFGFLRSLQWRLVFIFGAITLILMIVVWLSLIRQVEFSYYNTFKENIIKADLRLTDDMDYTQIVERIKNSGNFLFFVGDYRSYSIIDSVSKKVLFSSKYNVEQLPTKIYIELLSSRNFNTALTGFEGSNNTLMHITDSYFFDYAKPIGNESKYILYFRYDRSEWIGIINKFKNIIFQSTLFALFIALFLGYLLAKTITAPIGTIMLKAQKIAAGDFDQPIEVKSNDEIGKLSTTFNKMAGSLKKNLIEISSEKNKIETILKYMTDGILAFNLNGVLIHANPEALNILSIDNSIDVTFNDFSKEHDLGISLEGILYLETSKIEEKTITSNDKVIRIHFAVFTDEEKKAEGIILVLHDISKYEKLENMRRDFVANVSHELRTPLTSIKSYSETLLDGAMEDKEIATKFLGVINSESDRMTRLVKDLLQLSRLDNKQMQWNMHKINFVSLVKKSIDNMQFWATEKNQKLESYVIGEIPEIRGDQDRLQQVMVNILSNAIKYTPEKGSVTVYIGKIYSDVYVKVVDTGIGIPQEDISHIFERFYRVDKARSREMGGTGLGLAIAKEIVEAHEGSISVVSEQDKGTEITLKLPIKS